MGPPAGATETPSSDEGKGRARLAAAYGLLLLAVAIRLPVLGQRQLVEGDGVHYASLARQILIGDFSGLANPYWSNLWPGVIAGSSFLTGLDVVGGGRLASLFAGIALAALTALLGARLFGPREGLVAGALVAIHPWLVEFSTLVFTESFFALLLVTILLAGEPMIHAPTPRRAAGVGALAAAAIWTRPETYGVLTVLAVFLLAAGWKRRDLRKAAAALAVLLGFAAGSLVTRALVIHQYYDEWDFGQSKGTANLLMGIVEDKEQVSSGLTEDGENLLNSEMQHWTFTRFVLAHPGQVARHVGRNLVALAVCAWRVFPPAPVTMGREAFQGTPFWRVVDAVAVVCFALAVFGLVHGLRSPGTRWGAGLCGAAMAVHILGLAPLYVHERMIVVLAPLFLVLLAHGLVATGAFLTSRRYRGAAGASFFLLTAGLSAFGLLRSEQFDYASEPLVQKEAGLWLRERFPQTLRLMTVSPSIAFYFYDAEHQENEVSHPWAQYPALLAFARRERVDLVAASEWQLRAAGFPTASQLVPEGDHPGLSYVATVGHEPHRVHVFRFERSDEPVERSPETEESDAAVERR